MACAYIARILSHERGVPDPPYLQLATEACSCGHGGFAAHNLNHLQNLPTTRSTTREQQSYVDTVVLDGVTAGTRWAQAPIERMTVEQHSSMASKQSSEW